MTNLTDKDYIVVECVLRSKVLQHRTQGLLHEEAQAQLKSLVDPVWDQVCRDALIGTYRDYSEALFGKGGGPRYQQLQETTKSAAHIKPEFVAADLEAGALPFRLELQAKWFSHPRTGLQQLIHVLCGDIFGRATAEIRGSVEIRSVNLGRLGDVLETHYRQRSHDIGTIRKLFALDSAPLLYEPGRTADLPLLAFSFKPRNGLSQADFKRIAEGVLKAGFNLVEVDVRNIDFTDESWRRTYSEIAKTALGIGTHVARFSLNVSAPADLAIQYADEFRKHHMGHPPWVVKVDGGLDGLSTIQALREHFKPEDQPIITCYPILGSALASSIGKGTFLDMLITSGADIIYPGGAPRIGRGDFVDFERAEQGVARYKRLIKRGWPMPSIAGGVHAGQLPVYYEIFGPRVAFFLGGGVATHLNGAFYESSGIGSLLKRSPSLGDTVKVGHTVGGAELCRFAVEAAATEPDEEKLRHMLEMTREHYVTFDPDDKSDAKYGFENPKAFLTGSIRSFRD